MKLKCILGMCTLYLYTLVEVLSTAYEAIVVTAITIDRLIVANLLTSDILMKCSAGGKPLHPTQYA